MAEHTGMEVGTKARFGVDTAVGGAFTNNVALLNAMGVTLTGQNVDTTVFGATYVQRMQALQSATFTGGGFFDYYTDTTGQKLVMDNAVNGAALAGKIYLDGTVSGCHYIKSALVVSDFTLKTTPAGTIDFTFTADSTSTITSGLVP